MFRALLALLLVTIAVPSIAAKPARSCSDLPIARNAATLGWNAAGLQRARDEARRGGAAAFMVVTGGKVVIADGALAKPMLIASVRKSIMSALIGQAIAEGKLARTDPISKFGINEDSPLTETERYATVRDLLMARSGVYLPTAAETAAMRANRPARGSHAPGSFWFYNNWDFNVLGNLYERATAKGDFIAFQRRIAEPICMQDFDAYENTWYSYNQGAPRFPAYHMALSPRDLMRFGMLYLQKGRWGGTQVVPEAWVAESTQPLSMTEVGVPLHGAYGYLWWITTPDPSGIAPAIPPGSFTASGSGGQEMTVIPALDTVILVRADTTPDQKGASIFKSAAEWQKFVQLTLAARLPAKGN